MKMLQRRTAIATVMASLVFATAALAQMPTSPWKKGAPFPEPDEELYGVTANGKLYVIGGGPHDRAGLLDAGRGRHPRRHHPGDRVPRRGRGDRAAGQGERAQGEGDQKGQTGPAPGSEQSGSGAKSQP